MYDVEKEIRHLIVNIIQEYNKQLLIKIAKKFDLNEKKILDKYWNSYYYMPVIEHELKSLNIN